MPDFLRTCQGSIHDDLCIEHFKTMGTVGCIVHGPSLTTCGRGSHGERPGAAGRLEAHLVVQKPYHRGVKLCIDLAVPCCSLVQVLVPGASWPPRSTSPNTSRTLRRQEDAWWPGPVGVAVGGSLRHRAPLRLPCHRSVARGA
jgi:hypothetical protein